METNIEGNNPGALIISALFMAARLGVIFILPAAILSLCASIVAMRKKLIGLASLYFIFPLILTISTCLWYLSLSTGNDFGVATSLCTWILGISVQIPFILSVYLLIKITAKRVDLAVKTPVESGNEQGTAGHP